VGHAGGPPLAGEVHDTLLADAVEEAMDHAGFETAHIVGNSLGGYVALQLAERGRARSVVALAPAGGWRSDHGMTVLFQRQRDFYEHAQRAAAYVDGMLGVARCESAPAFLDYVEHATWQIDPERVSCPLRFIWGSEDEFLPWPEAAERYREQFFYADWVELDRVGHYPQLDTPTETAELVMGITAR
jgi:pimeloyl-ACP methyl ester carboxylesterase